jgi:MFS transporter, DHA1 family, multidrug resistance protein
VPAVTISRLRLLIVLGALSAIGPFAVDTYLPALPEIGADLHASASHVQLTITTFLVGLAFGQLLAGPMSDRFGRRVPLMVGMGVFAVVSLLCAAAPSVNVLIGLRVLQGMAGGFGVVIARAVVRDVYADLEAAHFFSSLMLFFGLGPILAPIVGGAILVVSDWHGVFVFLGLLGTALALTVVVCLPETLPPSRRHSGGLPRALGHLRELVGDRELMSFAAPAGLAHAAMIAYIAASSFVFQDHFGISAQVFALIFAANSGGMIVASRVGRRLMSTVGPRLLLRAGLLLHLFAAAALLLGVLGEVGFLSVAIPCFLLVSSIGLITPNAVTLGLDQHPEKAGAASGVFGMLQYFLGAAAAPLVGLSGASPVPMAIVVATLSAAAGLVRWTLAEPPARLATA